jgi:hypothetical protein
MQRVTFSLIALIAGAQSPTEDSGGRLTEARGFWADTSGLMWTGKDSGRDVNWSKAIKYCHSLRLAGFSDCRLPTIYELRGIYKADLESPGRAGYGRGREFTWHVEGGLFLTGDEWSSTRPLNERGRPSGYAWYFDFNAGKALNFDEPSAGKRALCVRELRTQR